MGHLILAPGHGADNSLVVVAGAVALPWSISRLQAPTSHVVGECGKYISQRRWFLSALFLACLWPWGMVASQGVSLRSRNLFGFVHRCRFEAAAVPVSDKMATFLSCSAPCCASGRAASGRCIPRAAQAAHAAWYSVAAACVGTRLALRKEWQVDGRYGQQRSCLFSVAYGAITRLRWLR